MTVEIKELSLLASTYIMANLRDADKREIAASSPNMTLEQFGFMAPWLGANAFCAWRDGNPVFMFGVATNEYAPNVGSAWGMGTNDTHRVMLAVSKFIRTKLIPQLLKSGMRRVEVRVIDTHHASRAWMIKRLGANLETLLPQMGANGETFLLLSWTKDKIRNVSSRPTLAA